MTLDRIGEFTFCTTYQKNIYTEKPMNVMSVNDNHYKP